MFCISPFLCLKTQQQFVLEQVGSIPDHLSRENFEENIRRVFEEQGVQVEKVKTRYKSTAAEGSSWALVTFRAVVMAEQVLSQGVVVLGDAPGNTGLPGKARVSLVMKSADTHAMDRSPIGIAKANTQIKVMQKALIGYQAYLPSSHPTLVRMHWAMAQLQRQTGDEDGAVFNEMESRRTYSVERIYAQPFPHFPRDYGSKLCIPTRRSRYG